MKFFVALSALFAITTAAAVEDQVVSVSSDTEGNYKLKYVIEGISRVEQRDALGNVNGGYSYIDPHGVLRKIEFTSGAHGFRAFGSDIPIQVPDTPEVAAAKLHHIELLRAAELKSAEIPLAKVETPVPAIIAPVPITPVVRLGSIPETPEVLAARAEHLAAHEAARKLLIK